MITISLLQSEKLFFNPRQTPRRFDELDACDAVFDMYATTSDNHVIARNLQTKFAFQYFRLRYFNLGARFRKIEDGAVDSPAVVEVYHGRLKDGSAAKFAPLSRMTYRQASLAAISQSEISAS